MDQKIFINQVGYLPKGDKHFLTVCGPGSFDIKNKDGDCVYSGKLLLFKENDSASGMTLYKGDFSSFTQDGQFTIETENLTSYPFIIGEDVFNAVRNDSIRSFYFQRSGMKLEKRDAGEFARPAGHTSLLEYHWSSPVNGSKDVSGGWYDAGDFGRYITPGSVAIGLMMMGYEQYPEKFSSDFLDEIRYELEWMLKMQYLEEGEFNGALPYMLNSRNYVWELPHVESEPQYIYDFSSFATADFAAVMALAARNFNNVDPVFAEKCLAASRFAWKFLKANKDYPAGGFQRPSDTKTGGYATNGADNKDISEGMFWAAVELFLTTGEQGFHDFARNGLNSASDFKGGMSWQSKSGFAKMQYVLGNHNSIDRLLQNKLTGFLIDHCNELLSIINSNGFHSSLKDREYLWGSNGELLTRAQYLIFAYLKTGNKDFYNGALDQLNYILGMNGNNICFVTNHGSKFPEHIHHAAMDTDGISASYPGLIPGGPNCNISQDEKLAIHFTKNTPPALCYTDDVKSFASNENCITYNAPLIPVSAFFSN